MQERGIDGALSAMVTVSRIKPSIDALYLFFSHLYTTQRCCKELFAPHMHLWWLMEGWWGQTTARSTLPSLPIDVQFLASTREFWNGVGSCALEPLGAHLFAVTYFFYLPPPPPRTCLSFRPTT